MPVDLVFHKGYALALNRFCNDGGGLALNGLCLVKRVFYLLKIVAVDFDHFKAEGFEFLVERFDTRNILNSAVYRIQFLWSYHD